ncbi:MAG: mandelate racemase/muconate lactonizing enzyme family protein, partial [Actinobacteria bacterium]|nr:mandelate racemase/muconate lactonizing enzyme family protein [Actinomycetota bacterium]
MSRIARVEAWPANAPLEAPYLMAPGTVPGISRTIVRVTTEDGVHGLGESASPLDAAELGGELGQAFVGRDTDEVRAELEPAEIAPPEHRTDAKVLIRNPRAGVEIALWDIAAREAGLPLHAFLAQDRDPLARIPVARTSLKASASRPRRPSFRSAPTGSEVPCRTQVEFTEYFAYRPGREDSPAEIAAYCARMVEEHDSPVFEGKVAVHPVDEDVRLVREIRAAIG